MQITRNSNSRVCYLCNKPAGLCVKSSFFFYIWKPYASLGAIHFDGPREEIYRHWIVTRLLITHEIRNTDGKSSRRWIFSPIVSRKDSREASSQLFTLTQGPGFTIGNNKVLPYSLSFGHCIACTICCQFCAANCCARDATGQPEPHYGNTPI